MTTEGTGFVSSSAYEPTNLFAGSEMPHVTEGVTFDADISTLTLDLDLGTVLSLKSNDKCSVVDTNVVGATNPYAILAESVTVTKDVDLKVAVYSTGEFNEDALIFGGSDNIEDHRAKLRDLGIYAKKIK